MLQVVTSPSAAARISAAIAFIEQQGPGCEVLLVGASRAAADDVARLMARQRGATFGLTRCSLTELAARAAVAAAGQQRMPGSQAAAEAMAARAVHEALEAGELQYFEPVARTPGFSKALARTLHELRLAMIGGDRLERTGATAGAADLARLLERVESELARAGVDDRAALFAAAGEAWRSRRPAGVGAPIVFLDVPLDAAAEQAFVAAVADASGAALATVPDGDIRAMRALAGIGATVETPPDPAAADSDLHHLRRYVFTNEQPPTRERAGDVRLFSAPGESREAVEIIRRVLEESARGVPFDEMAVLLRVPQPYLGLLEHASARAGVPVYFERGTRRPDPAGRAFIALLSCAVEKLSARRFDEYLSLGQVPRQSTPERRQPPVPNPEITWPTDEALGAGEDSPESDTPESAAPGPQDGDADEQAIVAGTLRSPWKWEELIVESHVVGGRTREDGRERWRRRLKGLANDYALRIAALAREEGPDSARIKRLTRERQNLEHLRSFALPIIDLMASWPDTATWADWLTRFEHLARVAIGRPDRILRTLADLRPMSGIADVGLEEARDVLRDRLVTLDWDPPARRYGRLFVGTPHQARGRTFKVVFVPGLAERVVPQRPREDPLLLDEGRAATDPGLLRQEDRGAAERLLLKIGLGAAADKLYLSYPRMDVAETRARVPSFYALDVVRAMTGRVPDHRVLASEAADEAGASLAWPAPKEPARAIDDLEHDLAILRPLLDSRDPASVRGRAHYLLSLNEALRRAVRSRYARGMKAWAAADGLVHVTPGTAAAIRRNRLGERAYSLSALQKFAACPYQFLLSGIHRLQPWEDPEPLVRMDPLTRGSLFHAVQAGFFRELDAQGRLPLTRDAVPDAVKTVERILDRVAAEYAEQLAPAIDRVWQDEIGELRRDLGIWVQRLADEGAWIPTYFEFSFGLRDEGRDPRSLVDPIRVDDRFVLRGSVDLIERRADGTMLRVTDHKTGKNRTSDLLVVGGGATLQPVLYSVAIAQGLNMPVSHGRLYFCTTAGGFGERPIEITDYTRQQGLQVLEIIDRAVEHGFLPAAPAERACTWCDFRPVCGPREEERVARKAKDRLADLDALRSMR